MQSYKTSLCTDDVVKWNTARDRWDLQQNSVAFMDLSGTVQDRQERRAANFSVQLYFSLSVNAF